MTTPDPTLTDDDQALCTWISGHFRVWQFRAKKLDNANEPLEQVVAERMKFAKEILDNITTHHTAQIAALKQRLAGLEGEQAGEDQASYEYRLITNRKHGHFVALESIDNPSKVSIENMVHECRLTNSIEKMGDNEFCLISASGEELNGFKYAVCNDSLEKKAWSEFEKRAEIAELAGRILGEGDA